MVPMCAFGRQQAFSDPLSWPAAHGFALACAAERFGN